MKILWAILCLLLSACAEPQPADVAIRGVTIVDVTDGSLHPDQTVLVEGNSIIAIGSADELSIAPQVDVVDGEGGYLVPGLWDMHAHATGTDGIESFFKLLLANGVTGIRDPWRSLEGADRARAAVATGELAGPARMSVAGNAVDGPPGSRPDVQVANTPEEGRRMVDSLHAAGVPFIKVYFLLAPETYFAIAKRSRELSLPFAGHVPFRVRAADASDARQRSIEHLTGVLEGCSWAEEAILASWRREGGRLWTGALEAGNLPPVIEHMMEQNRRALATQDDARCRRLFERFIENETWQVPTLVSLRGKAYSREFEAAGDRRTRYFEPPPRWIGGRPFGVPMSEEQWQVIQGRYVREKEIVGMMAAAGVPLLAGSDTATPWAFPGFGLHDELELLVEAGMTPLLALQAATLNPARFFERTDELGTVEEGKLADLVVLDANPLEVITNTRRIRAVVADGRLYRRADLDRILAEVEASVQPAENRE